MIPFLPELPVPSSGTFFPASASPLTAGKRLDFAGMLGALLPGPAPDPAGDAARLPAIAPAPAALVPPGSGLPDGMPLPERGTDLPEHGLPLPPAAPAPAAEAMAAPLLAPLSAPAFHPRADSLREPAPPMPIAAPRQTGGAEATPFLQAAPVSAPPAAAVAPELALPSPGMRLLRVSDSRDAPMPAQAAIAGLPTQPDWSKVRGQQNAAPFPDQANLPLAERAADETLPSPGAEGEAAPGESHPVALPATTTQTPAPIPAPILTAAGPVMIAEGPAAAAQRAEMPAAAAPPSPPPPDRAASLRNGTEAQDDPPALPQPGLPVPQLRAATKAAGPPPAASRLAAGMALLTGARGTPDAAPSSNPTPSPTPAPAQALPAPASAGAASPPPLAAPDGPALPVSAMIAAPAPPPVPSSPPPSLPSSPSPLPQQETAIAQLAELREALRTARPAMTVNHAEFGAIALRIEPAAAPDAWRAVLSARDPGFVPAIHAALAERAVILPTASADPAATGQQGGSDPRYGSSPGSGQGGSQPYPGQSQTRDENASPRPHQRAARTIDMVAARAAEAEAGPGGAQAGGVFA